MRKRAFTSVFVAGLLATVAVLSLAPGHDASPSPQLTPGCKCLASVFLQPDPNCPCPGITVSNVVTRRGKCTKESGGACVNPSTVTCQASGTASETGCPGGFSNQPFSLESACGVLGLSSPASFLCTNGGGSEHIVWLDCAPCSH